MADYQSGASAMREMAAKEAEHCLIYSMTYRSSIAAAIRAVPLPADPASSEGPDARKEQAARIIREIAEEEKARDIDRAEITIARCNLLLLEECCRYSLGLAGDLIGDALTKAVGDKVIAMRDEAADLRSALERAEMALTEHAIAALKASTP